MTDPVYLRVVIKRRVPSQNRSTYAHWSVYRKEKLAWRMLLAAALPRRQPPAGLVHLRLISFRNRLCDFANLVGGAKPIPDMLKELGYIRDDSPKLFLCDYSQHQVPRADERTILEFLTPLTNP